MTQLNHAATFRRLHFNQVPTRQPLVLPNAWDVVSARVIESAGATAIATTSAGVSWSQGRPDGQGLSRKQMTESIKAIVEAVSVPVSADIESGYGFGSPADVAETIKAVVEAGAVGINLEDSPGREGEPLLTPGVQAERIRAARNAAENMGADLFINARTDVYLAEVGKPEVRFAAVLERAASFIDAGADGIFVPGIADPETIASLVKEINAPLNILVGSGTSGIRELAEIGVARISLGSSLILEALEYLEQRVKELLTNGTHQAPNQGLPYAQVNGLFTET